MFEELTFFSSFFFFLPRIHTPLPPLQSLPFSSEFPYNLPLCRSHHSSCWEAQDESATGINIFRGGWKFAVVVERLMSSWQASLYEAGQSSFFLANFITITLFPFQHISRKCGTELGWPDHGICRRCNTFQVSISGIFSKTLKSEGWGSREICPLQAFMS